MNRWRSGRIGQLANHYRYEYMLCLSRHNAAFNSAKALWDQTLHIHNTLYVSQIVV